jgi:hypothetical protein
LPAALGQDELEAILLERARKSVYADVRFGTTVVHLVQLDDYVEVLLREPGTRHARRVRAQYVIGADGTWSCTRRAVGIGVTGPGKLEDFCSILFRANLDPLVRNPRCALYTVQTANGPGVLFPTGLDGRWVHSFPWRTELEPVETLAHDNLVGRVRAAVGVQDLEVSILDCGVFSFAATVAERFRERRIFLVGDAAHRLAPSGGMGLNSAIHDAHNLAWKLAGVLHGWAGEELLDTYEAERKPVAERNVSRSIGKHRGLSGTAADLGVVYATVDDDGHTLAADASDVAIVSARVGGRAPHVWLGGGWGRLSTLDLFGTGFVLLAGPDGQAWRDAAWSAAQSLDMPLSTYRIGDGADLTDPSRRWCSVYGVERGGAVLVRPDGVIAWRSAIASQSAGAEIVATLARLLSRRNVADRSPSEALRRAIEAA